jgi:hypothetical protein
MRLNLSADWLDEVAFDIWSDIGTTSISDAVALLAYPVATPLDESSNAENITTSVKDGRLQKFKQ